MTPEFVNFMYEIIESYSSDESRIKAPDESLVGSVGWEPRANDDDLELEAYSQNQFDEGGEYEGFVEHDESGEVGLDREQDNDLDHPDAVLDIQVKLITDVGRIRGKEITPQEIEFLREIRYAYIDREEDQGERLDLLLDEFEQAPKDQEFRSSNIEGGKKGEPRETEQEQEL